MSATLAPIPVSELAEWLAQQNWSAFAISLAQQFARNGRLCTQGVMDRCSYLL